LEAKARTREARSIGVGVMGLDTALRRMGFVYDSEEAVEFSTRLASSIQESVIAASQSLASKRGPFADFGRSSVAIPRRNAGLLSIAPTGGISSLLGVSSGIEPLFGSILAKEEFSIRIDTGSSMPLQPPEAIHWTWHLRHLAAWQPYVDGGISKTVNLPSHTQAEEILALLADAWKRDVKSVSLFCAGSRAAGVTAT
jgi:ribonucleoside-diphosphate reductase alpha chain